MLPLAGMRVLAIEQYGAGPFGTMFLADQGAEVIKIENPTNGGDIGRGVGPYFFEDGDSLFFQSFNRNKKSMTLDLSRPEGQAVLHKLVETADAVTSNLRGDVPAKLGLTYEHLKTNNAAIVCAHLSAYGRTGSRAAWPGFDYLMQAEAGYFALTGEPDTPPARFGLSVVDLMTGLGLAYATLAALTAARATGVGRDIDVSLFDMALHNVGYLATWYMNRDHNQGREPRSAHPSLTPCQLVKTKDGWIYVMCNKARFWPVFCELSGLPDLGEDARFVDYAARLENRALLTDIMDETLSVKTTDEWLEIYAGKFPAAPIYDVAQALETPFVQEEGRVHTVHHPSGEDFKMVASPVRVTEACPAQPAPAMGENTDAVLRSADFTDEQIKTLRSDGII